MELSIINLSKSYGHTSAVNKLNLKLTSGIYGLLGANGAGKTTFLKLVADLIRPTEGTIEIDGDNIWNLDGEYRRRLGFFPQHFGIYKEFTGNEFLQYFSALKCIEKQETENRINELLDAVDLSYVRDKKIKTYSGGMRQRLGIAQALLNSPDILLLDEPTAGLDPKERIKFRKLLSHYADDKIIILSTHIVSDIESIANTVIVMKKGNLLISGQRDDIIKAIHNKVWTMNVKRELIDELEDEFLITNQRPVDNHDVEVRIVSDVCPRIDAQAAIPTLDDLYMYYFGALNLESYI